jgi:hypothetical protein
LLSWRPQPIDAALVQRAREIELRHRLGWWDSMIVGAAQLQNCTVLLSEDLQDRGAYGGVTVRSPFTFTLEQPLAAYAVPAVVARSHPPRGRPRRPRSP